MNLSKAKSSLIGFVFIAFSIALLLLYRGDQVAERAAFSGMLIGIFLLFMRVRYTIPEQATGRIIESTTSSLNDVVEGLNIRGRGVFLPPKTNVQRDKVFVPLHDDTSSLDLKRIYDKSAFVTDDLTKNFGVLLNSPGGGLLELAENESEAKFKGIGAEMMCETIKIFEGLGFVSSIDATYEENGLDIVYSHSNYGENCSSIRDASPGICTRTCCPICSCILSSFARAEDRPLEILDVKRKNKVHITARYIDLE